MEKPAELIPRPRLRALAVLALAALLSGCGADGEPVQPTMNAGIGIGASGVNTYGGVGLNKGPISIFVGF